MSKTIVDMPKVAQMLDTGWRVTLEKNALGSYTATATHDNLTLWGRARAACLEEMVYAGWVRAEARRLNDADFDTPGTVETDDFTPEQALTRLAYKVHGEILDSTGESS